MSFRGFAVADPLLFALRKEGRLEDYRANSHKAKAEAVKAQTPPEKKNEKVMINYNFIFIIKLILKSYYLLIKFYFLIHNYFIKV